MLSRLTISKLKTRFVLVASEQDCWQFFFFFYCCFFNHHYYCQFIANLETHVTVLNSAKYVRHLSKKVQTERLNDATCHATVVKVPVGFPAPVRSGLEARSSVQTVAFPHCVICHAHPFTVLPDLN